jgi:hypothetical protein
LLPEEAAKDERHRWRRLPLVEKVAIIIVMMGSFLN